MVARIGKTETQIISIPLARPVEKHPYLGSRRSANFVLLELATDDGLKGFGLIHTSTVGKARALQALVNELRTFMAGRSVLEHEQIYRDGYRFFTDLGHSGAALQALAAVDIALWDLKGKALGQPLYKLLGGQRDRVPCYASGGLRRHQSMDELIADALGFAKQGLRAMKLRLGERPWAEDLERLRAVREAVGPEIGLLVDMNWSLTPSDAIRFGRLLEPFNLFWIEDPVAPEDFEGLAEVARALDTRVTFGETLEKLDQYRSCLELNAADCYMADLQRVGGISPWMRIASLVSAWHRPIASHVEPEVHAHLIAAAPNGLTVEYNPNHEALFTERPVFEDGALVLSNKPGLGVELNREVLKRYAVT